MHGSMHDKHSRQSTILDYIQSNQATSTSDILTNIPQKVDRKTLQRDLQELIEKSLIVKSGAGRSVTYSTSNTFSILHPVDIESYFQRSYDKRDAQETFNFNIFKNLENNVFTQNEVSKLDNLHRQFLTNFSQYESLNPNQ